MTTDPLLEGSESLGDFPPLEAGLAASGLVELPTPLADITVYRSEGRYVACMDQGFVASGDTVADALRRVGELIDKHREAA